MPKSRPEPKSPGLVIARMQILSTFAATHDEIGTYNDYVFNFEIFINLFQ